MSESLASFRDLKGIGPATEARLHETGIYTWEALATAAAALAAVRDNGDTPRDIANAVAARGAEAGEGRTAPRSPGGAERLEAFVLRISLTDGGEPQRSEVTHVRTMTEQAWAGWRPAELTAFVQKHTGIRPEPAPHNGKPANGKPAKAKPGKDNAGKEAPRKAAPRAEAPREPVTRQPLSADHVVVLDAGKAIGGTSRDVNLVVTNTRSARGDFGYRATLAARGLGRGQNGEGWTTVGTRSGTGSPRDEMTLGFAGIQLPPGIHRLQLRLEVNLAAPAERAPALALASG